MMKLSKLSAAQWAKLALIAGLSAILLAQLWPSGQAPSLSEETAEDGTNDSTIQVPDTTARRETANQRTWPDMDLSALLKHDPFEPPPALSRPKANELSENATASSTSEARSTSDAARPATTVLRWEGKRVTAILISPQGASAVVDSKICRLNDWLEPGVRVAEIRPDGVVLSLEAPK